ncbi:MAG TPA: citryl-CoA lyase [Pseudonocardia sp.]|uniref:citryl-CoA lyase n=1 Tax=Pseudonocardia sp. TaxID=60912 RepID=UPI002BCBAB30|nr:citryl-CoA lyase [Pseudonocardia sp.]HTF48285.1 citryl-CoA lyase [Pseudonocardia sp.]
MVTLDEAPSPHNRKAAPTMTARVHEIRSEISWSTASKITVFGHDLVHDLVGNVNLGDMGFLELTGRRPDPAESAMFNALTVSLVEHGMTPSAIATRLTHYGSPESLQGAVAAGLLGLGSTFVGSIEGAARYIQEASPEGSPDVEAAKIVDRHVSAHTPIPGIGHPIHKPVDPRAERLFTLLHENGLEGPQTALIREVARQAGVALGKELPVNVTGAIGAIASLLGIDWRAARGIGVMARAVGLVGHVLEEIRSPTAPTVWREVEEAVTNHHKPAE